jgi:hypothetical protein
MICDAATPPLAAQGNGDGEVSSILIRLTISLQFTALHHTIILCRNIRPRTLLSYVSVHSLSEPCPALLAASMPLGVLHLSSGYSMAWRVEIQLVCPKLLQEPRCRPQVRFCGTFLFLLVNHLNILVSTFEFKGPELANTISVFFYLFN